MGEFSLIAQVLIESATVDLSTLRLKALNDLFKIGEEALR